MTLTEKILALEDSYGSWPAYVMRHQNVCFYPDVFSCFNSRFASGAREDFFRQCHKEFLLMGAFAVGFCLLRRRFLDRDDVQRINLRDRVPFSDYDNQTGCYCRKIRMRYSNTRAVAQPQSTWICIFVQVLSNQLGDRK